MKTQAEDHLTAHRIERVLASHRLPRRVISCRQEHGRTWYGLRLCSVAEVHCVRALRERLAVACRRAHVCIVNKATMLEIGVRQ